VIGADSLAPQSFLCLQKYVHEVAGMAVNAPTPEFMVETVGLLAGMSCLDGEAACLIVAPIHAVERQYHSGMSFQNTGWQIL